MEESAGGRGGGIEKQEQITAEDSSFLPSRLVNIFRALNNILESGEKKLNLDGKEYQENHQKDIENYKTNNYNDYSNDNKEKYDIPSHKKDTDEDTMVFLMLNIYY